METKTAIIAALLLAPLALAQATAQGGNITQANITIFNQTTVWQGLAGTIIFIGPDSLPNLTAEGGEVNATTINLTSACTNPTATGFIFYSNSTNAPTGLTPGNLTQLDNFLNTGTDSASNTFTTNTTFNIGGPITNVPTTYTYVNNNSQSTVFREGYFNDASGNIVFVVEINLNTQGYNSSFFDFQAILPVFNQTTTTFYITNDITTTCPSPSPSGGGGSSGYNICMPKWICTNWGQCEKGLQIRTCKSSCGRAITRPPESKICESEEPPSTEEPKIVEILQTNTPTINAPKEINILAANIHTIPITISNNLPYSIEDFSIELKSDSTNQQYTPLHKNPQMYEIFGILPKTNTFSEHSISSRNIPMTLWPQETITLPLTVIGPPITPRTIQARINTYSGEMLLTSQPITIKTETPPFAFMRDTRQSTTTIYAIIDNRNNPERKTNLEIDFNRGKKTLFAETATINLPANSITAISQTYRTKFPFTSIKAESDKYRAEAR